MSIKSEKEFIKKEIEKIEDASLLKLLRYLILFGNKNEGRISLEQYNKELEAAEAEIEKGEFVTNDELKMQMLKWQKEKSL